MSRRFVPVAKHPGIARRGERYIVRTPKMPGRPSSFRLLTEAVREQGKRRSGAASPMSSERFDEYARRWVESFQGRTSRGISPTTRADYRDALERFAIPFFGRRPLSKVTPPDVRGFVYELAEKHGLAPASVRKYLAPVRAMFAELVEDGKLPTNPASVRVIGQRERTPRQPKVLSPEQTQALLAEAPEAVGDLFYLLALTGLRISEALGLQWHDMDRDGDGQPVLHVRRQFYRGALREETKGGEDRVVPLQAALARRLLRRRANSGYPRPSDPIFATVRGTHLDAHNVRKRLRPAAERAGVPWATPHVLRHSIASLLYERGWTDVQVAALLGHKDANFTRRTYIRPVDRGDLSVLDGVLVLGE
ncbi:MAG: tyrosine-type recombinase/integrase [Actinomycetota bacterium]|nr:tyrosine-type recombinase/integrase [Actinomycetota bacterium]